MPEQLSVLLIDDREKGAVLAQQLSAGTEPPAIRVESGGTLQEGLARLEKETFDAILLELNLPDSSGLETFAKVRQRCGNAALIVLTSVEGEGLALGALREGADDCLAAGDASGAALARRVRYAVERSRSRAGAAGAGSRRGKVLGFIGVKGGTGTTTVALNVAAVLARQGKSTIALEMKPDLGLFSFQLNHSPAVNLRSLTSLPAGRIDAVEVGKALCSFPQGLRVLFGPQRPDEFGDVDAATAEAVVQTVSRMAEYTVIDLPSLAFGMSQAAIRQCHFVSMVLERDSMSAYAAKNLAEVLHSWGISQQITGAIVVSRTMSYTPTPINDIASQLGCPIFGVVPPAVELCARASNVGTPIVFLEPESTYSNTLTELTLRLAADFVKPMSR